MRLRCRSSARFISTLVVLLTIVGVTIAVGLFVSRFAVASAPQGRPSHLQVVSKSARVYQDRLLRVELVVSNPTDTPFCITVSRVAIHGRTTTPSEVVNIASPPRVVVASGATQKYEVVVALRFSTSAGVAVATLNAFACTSVQNCSCSGTPSYVDAVFSRIAVS